jgi:hypothetical protein
MHWRWDRLGRVAYLSHESQYFDRYDAYPAPAIHPIITFVVAALIIFGLYKCLVFVAAKILSALTSKSGTAQG